MLRHDLQPNERGTFAALGDPHLIDHVRRLGVTTVELLPVHAFVQDRPLLQKGLRNYWGYNTIGFFAPEPRYLSDNTLDEMRIAVRRLHAAGLEVILDVVYNHTGEGSEMGPTLSFRGLDNASYYRLVADNPRHCVNDTGTGNTLNLSTPRVLQMVMDSLRYWVTAFHIDGFRFDLGVTLGREDNGFDQRSGFFDAIRQDPVLSRVKLISEPLDLEPGGYLLGQLGSRGADRGSRDPRHQTAPAARAARHALPGAGNAHAAGRRRVRPRPARQQQRLLPGQRDRLARLEAGRGRRGQRAHRLCRKDHRASPPPCGAARAALLAWPARAGAGHQQHRLVRGLGRTGQQRLMEQARRAAAGGASRGAQRRWQSVDPDNPFQRHRRGS